LSDILPALWMMAGCRGNMPRLTGGEKMLFFDDCPFSVLVDESRFKSFVAKLAKRHDIEWVFLVSNDQDTFARMSDRLPEHIPTEQRVHLWRNYLDNFVINTELTPGHSL
jgi:adenine-specific DNA-methyltransferase